MAVGVLVSHSVAQTLEGSPPAGGPGLKAGLWGLLRTSVSGLRSCVALLALGLGSLTERDMAV